MPKDSYRCNSGKGPNGRLLAFVEQTHIGVPKAECRTEDWRRRHCSDRALEMYRGPIQCLDECWSVHVRGTSPG